MTTQVVIILHVRRVLLEEGSRGKIYPLLPSLWLLLLFFYPEG